ncbi:retropepsin-like protein [Striga asiatica]|uniref:Retropepsin-like protein n=1 Tax=Striga asiatica TaxID=4170 RepID=A0A5A7Q5E9_STRAF|nr:retropepsin-like protein [Striga asiatica]
MDRNMLDAASGGTLMDKTPTAARDLIANMAANSQQFGTREASFQSVNEAGIGALESQVKELTTFVRKLATEGFPRVQPCMRCETTDHITDNCPLINGEVEAQANTIGSNNGPGRNYDPFSNTYNPGWRDHPNLRYGNPSGGVYAEKDNRPPQIFQRGQNFPRQAGNGPPSSMPQSSLEEMIRTLATSSMNFQQGVQESIKNQELRTKNLEGQMSQLAEHMTRIDAQLGGRLPSQPEINPKNVSAITLQSGKELVAPKTQNEKNESEKEGLSAEYGAEQQNTGTPSTQPADIERRKGNPVCPPLKPEPLPFPSRVRKATKEDAEKQVLDVFKKVEINIPLIDAIKQVPRYAKFLKDLCTNKRRLQGNEKVLMGENVSAIFKKDLPQKRSDPGMFSIPCTIGNLKIERAMLDLGASINVMPRSIFDSLNLGPLKETRVVIQLADRSTTFPDGDSYVGPDFVRATVLEHRSNKIDVREGTLTMEFDGNVIRFNIFDDMKLPDSDHCVYILDCIEPLTQDFHDTYKDGELELVISQGFDKNQAVRGTFPGVRGAPVLGLQRDSDKPEFLNHLGLLEEAALEHELKSLPSHLKYAYWGMDRPPPVIVSSSFEPNQMATPIEVLKNFKRAIDWAIADLRGMSLSIYMHCFLLEEDAKPSREAQRRLNPPMMEVVKNKIIKLLDVGVIYPSPDSRLVSTTQVVPKKSRKIFKVNGDKLKPYYGEFGIDDMERVQLDVPQSV